VRFEWEMIQEYGEAFDETWLQRAKVPGGWIVRQLKYKGTSAEAMCFVPDPNHEWDGQTLVQEEAEHG